MSDNETPSPAAEAPGVPRQRGGALPLPPASIPPGPDGEGLTDGMKEAYWSVYDGAAAQASVRQLLGRLPRITGQVGALAWRADPRAMVAVVALQLASAAMAAFGLMASVAVLQELFAHGPTPDRVRAAAPHQPALRRPIEFVQYTSREFADPCGELGVTQSMGAVGTSADNAACESLHAALKRETLRGAHHYPGAELCRRTVFRWLTRYNTRRRHSANGHLSPMACEHQHQQQSDKLTLAARSPERVSTFSGEGPSPSGH